MLHFAENETANRHIRKLTFLWGLATVMLSEAEPDAGSTLSGGTSTVRLSLFWLAAVTFTASTVQHLEFGIEARLGPLDLYT